jgi:hypothetical protein
MSLCLFGQVRGALEFHLTNTTDEIHVLSDISEEGVGGVLLNRHRTSSDNRCNLRTCHVQLHRHGSTGTTGSATRSLDMRRVLLCELGKATLEDIALSFDTLIVKLLDRVNTRSGVLELERSRVVNDDIFTALPVLELLALVRIVLESFGEFGDIERWTFQESGRDAQVESAAEMGTSVLCRDTQIQDQHLLGSRLEQVAKMLRSNERSRIVQGTGHRNSVGSELELRL